MQRNQRERSLIGATVPQILLRISARLRSLYSVLLRIVYSAVPADYRQVLENDFSDICACSRSDPATRISSRARSPNSYL